MIRPLTALAALSLTASVLLAASPAGAMHAATPERVAPASKPVVHKYVVTYELTGHLETSTDHPDDSQGFCPGTGSAEGADFTTKVTYVVTLEDGKRGQFAGGRGVQDDPSGTWTMQGTQVAQGDSCDTASSTTCSGGLETRKTGKASLYTKTTRKKVAFNTTVHGLPTETTVPTDCRQDEAYSPVVDFGLYRALYAWQTAEVWVSWKKLGMLDKGDSITRRTHVYRTPPGYSLDDCDHSSVCVAKLRSFAHTITVKRTK